MTEVDVIRGSRQRRTVRASDIVKVLFPAIVLSASWSSGRVGEDGRIASAERRGALL